MDFEQLKGRCKTLAQVGDEQANATLRLFEVNTELYAELNRVRSELAKKSVEGAKTPAAMTEGLAAYMLSQVKRTIEHCEKFGVLADDGTAALKQENEVLKQENEALKAHLGEFLGLNRISEILAWARSAMPQFQHKVPTLGADGVMRHVATGEELDGLPATHFRSPEEVAAAATRKANGMAASPPPGAFELTRESAGHKSEGTGV